MQTEKNSFWLVAVYVPAKSAYISVTVDELTTENFNLIRERVNFEMKSSNIDFFILSTTELLGNKDEI